MVYKVGDRVCIAQGVVRGTVTSVNPVGYLGVAWDDGDVTPEGMLHPDDVVGLDDTDSEEERRLEGSQR